MVCCQNVFGQERMNVPSVSRLEEAGRSTAQQQTSWMDVADQFSDFHSEDLNLYAKSAVLTDAETGRILYGKAANTSMANASTTKIMTCLLAIESGMLGDTVSFSEYACKNAESTAWMLCGHTVCTGRSAVFPDAGIP
mgnify:CR=1 FL=1